MNREDYHVPGIGEDALKCPAVALSMFIKALSRVGKEFMTIPGLPEEEPSDNAYIQSKENVIKLGERCFAYELYRQWGNLLEDYNTANNLSTFLEKFHLNGELPKNILDGGNEKIPDFVLHKGQWDTIPENHILICELKRYSTKSYPQDIDVVKDLYKLGKACEGINAYDGNIVYYSRAIFLMINSTPSQMSEKVIKAINILNRPSNTIKKELKKYNTTARKVKRLLKLPRIQNRILCISLSPSKEIGKIPLSHIIPQTEIINNQ